MSHPTSASLNQQAQRSAQRILDFIAALPDSAEPAFARPHARMAAIALAARRRAFVASASLALPPGPLGWLTVLPELVLVWKVQAQMVADMAAASGQRASLTREQMLYCLFRHAAAQAVRDLGVRVGQRWIVYAASSQALRGAAERIGVQLSQRALGSSLARVLPIAGALGVGAYAWYDTLRVSRTAASLFSPGVDVVTATRSIEIPAQRIQRAQRDVG